MERVGFDPHIVKKDFKILDDPSRIYLDNAATTHKPKVVLDALRRYYEEDNGNPHRGAHLLAVRSTEAYEKARERVADFIGAKSPQEVVFTRGATEGLNLLSTVLGRDLLQPGDEILITVREHHANLVNWQQIGEMTGAKLLYGYLREDFSLDLEDFYRKIGKNTKVVAFAQASNVTGEILPVEEMIAEIRKRSDALIIIDGAQSTPHMAIDVAKLDCDFFVASGHKMLAPMGIGFLYGKKEKLDALRPFHFGGDMIEYVYEDRSTFLDGAARFEAGTQNVGGAVALAAAMDYLEKLGMDNIAAHEKALIDYAYEAFQQIEGISLYTVPGDKAAVLSFNLEGAHPHDVATILDSQGVMVRSGHHCAQPLHRYLGRPYSSRASFYVYNTKEDVDALISGMEKVKEVLRLGHE